MNFDCETPRGVNDGKMKLSPNYEHNSVPLAANGQDAHFGYAHPVAEDAHFGYAHPAAEDAFYSYAHPALEDAHFGYAHPAAEDAFYSYAHPASEDALFDYAHPAAEDAFYSYAHPASEDAHFGYAHSAVRDAHFGYAQPAAVDDCIFFWGHQINKSQIPQDGRTLFFTNDISFRAGGKMKLLFNKINNEAKFLSFKVAKSLPASSDKLNGILNLLSVNPESILARDINTTMEVCEEKGVKDIYSVSLVGADGQQGKAVAVCHKDTSTWNPRHYAFQFLKTKPGTKPSNMGEKQIVACADPYYLSSSDNPNTSLGSIIFNGKNYIKWSRGI
ncbi:BURP domain protein RD22 [Bienertia sinuspersici]